MRGTYGKGRAGLFRLGGGGEFLELVEGFSFSLYYF